MRRGQSYPTQSEECTAPHQAFQEGLPIHRFVHPIYLCYVAWSPVPARQRARTARFIQLGNRLRHRRSVRLENAH
jgi:hypothetical protein